MFTTQKRNLLLLLFVWAGIYGFLLIGLGPAWETPIAVVNWIVCSILLVQWTYFDAAERKYQLWRFFAPMMVICPGPLLVMPVYFILSRGWKRGLLACMIAVGLLLLMAVVSFVGMCMALPFARG